ncbi:Transposase type 1 [Trinorchestia longiramus]|nr:Transposase type 1 [Trinorchestia longiramus]
MRIKSLGVLKCARCSLCTTPTIPFLTELSLVTKSGSFMITVNDQVNGSIVMSPKHFPKPMLHQKKIMVTVWWSAIGVIHYSFLGVNETLNAERYCNDLAVMHARLSEKRPALVNRRGPILFHDNARPHVARMTVQKLTELGYETLPHPPYSPDLSPTDYHLIKRLSAFLDGKTFRSKQEVETIFKDFVASQPLTFYQHGINNLVVRWQRCIAAQDSYFD